MSNKNLFRRLCDFFVRNLRRGAKGLWNSVHDEWEESFHLEEYPDYPLIFWYPEYDPEPLTSRPEENETMPCNEGNIS